MLTKKQNLVQFFYRKSQTSNKKIASSAMPKLAITAQECGREDLRKQGDKLRLFGLMFTFLCYPYFGNAQSNHRKAELAHRELIYLLDSLSGVYKYKNYLEGNCDIIEREHNTKKNLKRIKPYIKMLNAIYRDSLRDSVSFKKIFNHLKPTFQQFSPTGECYVWDYTQTPIDIHISFKKGKIINVRALIHVNELCCIKTITNDDREREKTYFAVDFEPLKKYAQYIYFYNFLD